MIMMPYGWPLVIAAAHRPGNFWHPTPPADLSGADRASTLLGGLISEYERSA